MYVKSPSVYDGITEKPKVPNGYILYAVFLPIIGLFLERYAYSFTVAVALWVLVVVLMCVSCALDKRMLDKHDVNTVMLGKSYLFPPLYIYKRQVRVGGESMLCVASITLIAGALFTNGLVKGLLMSPSRAADMVPNTAVTQLDNFSGKSQYSIGECVSAYSSKDVDWQSEKKSYGYEVTAAGEHDSKNFKIIFKLEYDGFTFHAFLITGVEQDGKTLDADGRKDFYKDVFINYGNKADSSSQAGSSSQADSSKEK